MTLSIKMMFQTDGLKDVSGHDMAAQRYQNASLSFEKYFMSDCSKQDEVKYF